ncbi:MAG TPA: hypothetical protein DEE98_02960 [Elusimicrobia bacterium]|nr:MAG: hypothetical protein A2278_07785 [Elusimicrobia bacterium RIFOXYA12_FULL_49_49]OGS08487.1 MAG: hypothetical protein A2204_00010 [Elusimicrobia bacterium RIFOXYA1_FULL_47_7]OGS16035.1 MAG: hypothetical protein A2251_02480 [Elusimicrobia bacterium RIFOXYA2_FULL_47_53]OGS25794.1 MAG: hypothetical protein A2339_05155 [Elusimicrobia bacterium RIFOXYB12_FULL_50_12]OGS30213.1 MAG: hypothetical protein A2323_02055 [Elusimicrobia bacterium RIFOXYB2_FULL_46_23]HBU69324.1 hypothetical protein [El
MTKKLNSEIKFSVDFMLGRLARRLRILGYDARYFTPSDRASMLLESLREDRVILTRDHNLSAKKSLRLVLIESQDISQQIRSLAGLKLINTSGGKIFTRCSACNTLTLAVSDREEVKDKVPQYVFNTAPAFSKCPGCGKIYWEGTHKQLLLEELKSR